MCTLAATEDSQYLTKLTPRKSIIYFVWFGTVNALAQDRRTGSRLASFWKAAFFPSPKIRDVGSEPFIMAWMNINWECMTFPENFFATIDALQNCRQPRACLVWSRCSYPLPLHSTWARQGYTMSVVVCWTRVSTASLQFPNASPDLFVDHITLSFSHFLTCHSGQSLLLCVSWQELFLLAW